MSKYELEDRNGTFILGVDSTESLQRVLKFMRANDDEADEKLIVWEHDANNDIFPLDPKAL